MMTAFKWTGAIALMMIIYSLGNPDKTGSKEIDFNIFQKFLLDSDSVKKKKKKKIF